MSASVCSSSRRMPLRLTRSSTDANRCERCGGCGGCERCGGCVQSCEHVLQKKDPGLTISSMDWSSHPHLGQTHAPDLPDPPDLPDLPAPSIAFPISSRR